MLREIIHQQDAAGDQYIFMFTTSEEQQMAEGLFDTLNFLLQDAGVWLISVYDNFDDGGELAPGTPTNSDTTDPR